MTHSPDGSDWSAGLAKIIAGEIKRHRKKAGMTAQDLSQACAAVGMEIPRSVIANLESHRRAAVSVAELLVFARALKVSPVELVAPVGYIEEIEYLPGDVAKPMWAASWISGEAIMDDEDPEDVCWSALEMARRLEHQLGEATRLHREALALQREYEEQRPAATLSAELYRQAESDYHGALEARHSLLARMTEAGSPLPDPAIGDQQSEAIDALTRRIEISQMEIVAHRARVSTFNDLRLKYLATLTRFDHWRREVLHQHATMADCDLVVDPLPEWINDFEGDPMLVFAQESDAGLPGT